MARRFDRGRVFELLREHGLPTAGVSECFENFLVAEQDMKIIGCVGLEIHGNSALLRSLSVAHEAQGHLVGKKLVERIIAKARGLGVEQVALLTTTAVGYFGRFGFSETTKDGLPPELLASEEFRSACPESAVAMSKSLG